MLIDWFTVIAQILNFIILVWLLKRFLYKPVLQAIDNREKRIAGQLQDAAQKEMAAKGKQEEYERKNLEFEKQRDTAMKKVAQDSQLEGQKLMDEARKDADLFRSKLLDSLKNEQNLLSLEMVNHTRQEVFAIARKVLADLAGISLEEKITETFINRLQNLSAGEKEQLARAIESDSSHNIELCSVANLDEIRQKAIQAAVHEIYTGNASLTFRFRTSPELVSGIELRCGGYKTSWNIDDYLNILQKNVADFLKNKVESELKTG